MSVETKKSKPIRNKFALRLMPSVRVGAERVSATEGVSLNQFINVAIAEKVARVENQQWAAARRPFDDAARADALDLLQRSGTMVPEAGDELPAEYVAWRNKRAEETFHSRSKRLG
jgi:hypothetical protein